MPKLSTLVPFYAIVIAGCGGGTVPLRMIAGHPANPQSPEARVARLAPLEPDAFDRMVRRKEKR